MVIAGVAAALWYADGVRVRESHSEERILRQEKEGSSGTGTEMGTPVTGVVAGGWRSAVLL